eukprot:1161454-Pelagomonas_calceolata.AAC.11
MGMEFASKFYGTLMVESKLFKLVKVAQYNNRSHQHPEGCQQQGTRGLQPGHYLGAAQTVWPSMTCTLLSKSPIV